MEIESNDVIGGPNALTPTFSQRTMSGKARIPNGRTVMIASVAQDKQSRGSQGLPLLGLIPILGRLFATPTNNSSNADIVITVLPRVLSAPFVTPEDLETHQSGTLQSPISDSLEAMVRDAEREDNLAAARKLPTNTTVEVASDANAAMSPATQATQPATQAVAQNSQTQTADASNPAYVPAPKLLAGVGNSFTPGSANNVATEALAKRASAANMMPVVETEDVPPPAPALKQAAPDVAEPAQLILMSGQREMKVGERQRVMVFVKTDAPLSLAAATLKFDPRVFAVRSVEKGSLFTDASKLQAQLTQSVDARGSLLALVAPAAGSPLKGAGVLLFVEIEALAAGDSEIGFDLTGVHLMSADGRNVAAKTTPVRVAVRQ
jgi:hypothetical protein